VNRFVTGANDPVTIERDGAELLFNSPRPGLVTIRRPVGDPETLTIEAFTARENTPLV
jgi:hypothetical protein